MHAQFDAYALPWGRHVRARFWYTVATVVTTVLLIAWGGFVTSIDAGLAVPDWPSSFNSYDPFNPWPEWWTLTPVLAEHGHRLIGAFVGILLIGVAGWTWFADSRAWMRRLGVAALVLVVVQGALGGLRVVWVSLDLAVIHAAVAQIFFSLLVCMVLFTSRTWKLLEDTKVTGGEHLDRSRMLALTTTAAIYLQIILGALLRHPGTGIDVTLVTLHIIGAILVLSLAIVLYLQFRRRHPYSPMQRGSGLLLWFVVAQVTLGLTAYIVLLDERGMLVPSNLQVVVNTFHLVLGAFVFATSVIISVLAVRAAQFAGPPSHPAASAGSYNPVQPSNFV